MSLWSRLRDRWVGESARHTPRESDTPADARSARTREAGGAPDPGAPDTHSTTGTTPSDTFVGRPSGDDPGEAGKSGAEVRGEHGQHAAGDETSSARQSPESGAPGETGQPGDSGGRHRA